MIKIILKVILKFSFIIIVFIAWILMIVFMIIWSFKDFKENYKKESKDLLEFIYQLILNKEVPKWVKNLA